MKKAQWQKHVEACHQSGLSKRVYAAKHGISYNQLLYWTKKLSLEVVPRNFVSVSVKPSPRTTQPTECLGVVEFPNGARLVIHSPELLSLVSTVLNC